MVRCLTVICGLFLLSGCASTLTSQSVQLLPPPAQKFELGIAAGDIDLQEAKELAQYKNDFYSVLISESNGMIGSPAKHKPQMHVVLRYNSDFAADDFIGITSFFIPFLAMVPDVSKQDYFVDFMLRDGQENIIYSKRLRGVVEGESSGYYIARIDAASDLKKKQARFVAENAARMIVNDVRGNAATINAKLHAPREIAVAAATPAQPQPVVIRSDVDTLPAAMVRGNSNAYAIVIGLERYRQKLPVADFATHDARTVAEYLTKVLGYPEENVVVLTNEQAALGDFVKYIEKWLPNNVEQNGKVFVYYSGHGAPSPYSGDAYLVPYDGDPAFIDETGYSLKRMYDALSRLPAQEVLVALDSCFSGGGGRSVIAKGARSLVAKMKVPELTASNLVVLSASSESQISSTYDEKGHGLFTYFLLKGIKHEEVVSPDGSIRTEDLFGYLKPQVERIARKQYNNEQTPQLQVAKKPHPAAVH